MMIFLVILICVVTPYALNFEYSRAENSEQNLEDFLKVVIDVLISWWTIGACAWHFASLLHSFGHVSGVNFLHQVFHELNSPTVVACWHCHCDVQRWLGACGCLM